MSIPSGTRRYRSAALAALFFLFFSARIRRLRSSRRALLASSASRLAALKSRCAALASASVTCRPDSSTRTSLVPTTCSSTSRAQHRLPRRVRTVSTSETFLTRKRGRRGPAPPEPAPLPPSSSSSSDDRTISPSSSSSREPFPASPNLASAALAASSRALRFSRSAIDAFPVLVRLSIILEPLRSGRLLSFFGTFDVYPFPPPLLPPPRRRRRLPFLAPHSPSLPAEPSSPRLEPTSSPSNMSIADDEMDATLPVLLTYLPSQP
mmetsp:Transcript_3598/g.8048  ORF Transcript_3598/g.8048 Transcript_3598/m.8048 type:complete len:265 (+) Transcript_3598:697-1491(+)